ncbi:MAG: hypothetical protein MK172_08680, partial [Verrucomicrobiales bacterium]|nr:hypothetical protein [Verrucomicrobiales bacterium]
MFTFAIPPPRVSASTIRTPFIISKNKEPLSAQANRGSCHLYGGWDIEVTLPRYEPQPMPEGWPCGSVLRACSAS